MKRDWWKIRHVLQELSEGRPLGLHPDAEVLYAAKLCRDADFIRGLMIGAPSLREECMILGSPELTAAGHDALAVLSDADALAKVLAEHGEGGLPWEILRAVLIRERWPEATSKIVESKNASDLAVRYRVPQSRRCPLCEGTGRDPVVLNSGATVPGLPICPHCKGARIVYE